MDELNTLRKKVYEYDAIVIRVYDGDTVFLDIDLGFGIWMRNQAIRLRGINTPELRGSEYRAGAEARDWLRNILPEGKRILLRTTKGKRATGKYGRILGELFVSDGSGLEASINQMLLDEGLAVPFMA